MSAIIERPDVSRRSLREAIVATLGIAAAVCACTVTTIRADVTRPLAVDIRLSVDSSIAAGRITAQLKNEAEAIWRPYGIQFDWDTADAFARAAGFVSLDASVERQFERDRRQEWPKVLGRVVINPATPSSRPIHVSVDATESVLAQRTNGPRTLAGIVLERDLALALGRVLAHEIGHVLLGASGHDQAGLMRATFSAEELAEPDSRPFRLTCGSADRLRSRLAALAGDTQLGARQDSGRLDSESRPTTRPEFRGDASCIAVEPAR